MTNQEKILGNLVNEVHAMNSQINDIRNIMAYSSGLITYNDLINLLTSDGYRESPLTAKMKAGGFQNESGITIRIPTEK